MAQTPDAGTSRNLLSRYVNWLHTRWPAGVVEALPEVQENGSTNLPGVYVVGDLTGIPLLKFSADSGARAIEAIVKDAGFRDAQGKKDAGVRDVVVIGAGVSGVAAALAAKKAGLDVVLVEATQMFSTVANFPKGKPIYTYPKEMHPAGDLQFHAEVKEGLLDELHSQARELTPQVARIERIERARGRLVCHVADKGQPIEALRVIVAIGRSGNFRKLNVPGEDKNKVYNRLHDPKDYAGKKVLVVGGGDSALETAIALCQGGAEVTLSYRKPTFARPKPDNLERIEALVRDPMAPVAIEQPTSERVTTASGVFLRAGLSPDQKGKLTLMLPSEIKEIGEKQVTLVDAQKQTVVLENDVVFSMIGREPPLDFFRRSGIRIAGERTPRWWLTLCVSLLFFTFVYHWKKPGVHIAPVPPLSWIAQIGDVWQQKGLFPTHMSETWASLGGAFADKHTVLGTLKVSVGEPGFYYSLLYCVAIGVFGLRRIKRRGTPYVKWQTLSLFAVQVVPLFLMPYLILPWLGNNGAFDSGGLKTVADSLMPLANYGHGREYWRAFGFILAWPLFFWNVFTYQPLMGWLVVSLVQTFVIIPLLVWRFGKGAYCGWICSCGALAETLGDTQRTKMPHGPRWNRLNLIGQVFLLFAFVLLGLRIGGWVWPGGAMARAFEWLLHDAPVINYVWFVDLLWAGIIGVALYWHFSGRMWCRFACPLAALMHIYARFSRFRIFPEKKKCISCNVCTSVCHMGIDVMNFANKGLPMQDPECVRCSACVQGCPTGTLSFGMADKHGALQKLDRMPASLVQIRENPLAKKKSAAV